MSVAARVCERDTETRIGRELVVELLHETIAGSV